MIINVYLSLETVKPIGDTDSDESVKEINTKYDDAKKELSQLMDQYRINEVAYRDAYKGYV